MQNQHFLLSLQHFQKYPSQCLQKSELWCKELNLSQTTNFRLVKFKSMCRRQNKGDWKFQNCFLKGTKQCGKRRKCCLQHFLFFPQCFKKGFSFGVEKVGIVWKRLNKSYKFINQTKEKIPSNSKLDLDPGPSSLGMGLSVAVGTSPWHGSTPSFCKVFTKHQFGCPGDNSMTSTCWPFLTLSSELLEAAKSSTTMVISLCWNEK